MYDTIFVSGQAAIDRYAEHGVALDPGQLVVVGRPQLAGILRAAPGGPVRTVLYAPTWSGYNAASNLSSLPNALPFLEDLVRRGVRVLFRPHPLSSRLSGDVREIARIDEYLRSLDGGHMLSTEGLAAPLEELLNASDAMLSDISSMLVDYLASAKPMAIISATTPDALRRRYPSARPAYIAADPSDTAWDNFLGADPLREERLQAAVHYLGSGEPEAFAAAVRQVLGSHEPLLSAGGSQHA